MRSQLVAVLVSCLAGASCGHSVTRAASSSAASSMPSTIEPTLSSNSAQLPSTGNPLEDRATVLRARLGPRFTVLVEPPFVVAGDGGAGHVKDEAVDTVRWATTKLKQDFFQKDPAEIIDVFLFKDADSYTSNTRTLFHQDPISRFGYYSPDDHALIMNIATGGGTLVHEMVHAFMRTNFPTCPIWLNEGLAALFEHPTEVDGHIEGLTNWRLPTLQEAIAAHRTLPLEKLFELDVSAFYGDGSDLHYAEARYLLYWLQLKGQLIPFFRESSAHAKDDPTAYATLRRVVKITEIQEFQQKWETWVTKLTVD